MTDAVENEERLIALRETGLLDSEAEADFDRLTELAARILHVPTALVSLVDTERQFFKSAFGLGEPWASKRETPLSHSFCKHTVRSREALIVGDARQDPRVKDNFAVRDLGVVAYAGVPLRANDQVIGAFCVIDGRPRQWTNDEISILREFGHTVERLVQLRHANRLMADLHDRFDEQSFMLRQALALIPDNGVMIFDRDLRFVAAAGPALRTFGLDPDNMVGKLAAEVHSARNVAKMEALYRFALDGHEGSGEFEHDGRVTAVHTVPLRSADGNVNRGMIVFRDITEQRRETATLRAVASTLPNGTIAIFDRDLRFVFADGPLLQRVTGLTPEEIIGRDMATTMLAPGETERDVSVYARAIQGESTQREVERDGRVYENRISPVLDYNGRIIAGAAFMYDITDRKREAITDELTGLHNRRGFLLLAEQSLLLARRNHKPLVVFFLDLNGMKQINDKLGHEFGDQALIATAEVLRKTFRASDIVSRLGGDEFAVLAVDSDRASIDVLIHRVEDHLAAYNAQKKVPFTLSVSVGGVVREPKSDVTLQALLTEADVLMYEKKRSRQVTR